ncbi:hypothetical protein CES85_5495 [Ochrobactrum quorumnocens]|uniref:Uncharacterized protein n=1 Tax=Ochrobactrum quorumnocens TaxID=271865 RepID=A0A248UEF3_9HYPH|nr:hypothetical protein CES85_5495 [[Ochrobactrum] quorumnocens]
MKYAVFLSLNAIFLEVHISNLLVYQKVAQSNLAVKRFQQKCEAVVRWIMRKNK